MSWVIAAVAIWLALAATAADYGRHHGYPFFPLFVCGACIGFPLVLLTVAIASRHQPYVESAVDADPETLRAYSLQA